MKKSINILMAGAFVAATMGLTSCDDFLKENPPKEERVTLALEGLQVRKAEIVRIDENHANAYPEWVKMGSPDYPSDSQIHTLIGVSALHAKPLEETSIMLKDPVDVDVVYFNTRVDDAGPVAFLSDVYEYDAIRLGKVVLKKLPRPKN